MNTSWVRLFACADLNPHPASLARRCSHQYGPLIASANGRQTLVQVLAGVNLDRLREGLLHSLHIQLTRRRAASLKVIPDPHTRRSLIFVIQWR
jgi:hypothetical protein